MSTLDDAIGQAHALVTSLEEVRGRLEPVAEPAAGDGLADAEHDTAEADVEVPVEHLSPEELAARAEAAAELGQHDNALPFKCPACGATYVAQVACTNGHAAVLMLPTAEVLAGAAPPASDAAEAVAVPPVAAVEAPAGSGEPSSSSTSETTETAAAAAPEDPQWPGGAQ